MIPRADFATSWDCWCTHDFLLPRHIDKSSNNGTDVVILIRATKPEILIRMALPLVSQAITAATADHKSAKDVLMNGVSYFTGPLLNWVLVGVIRYLIREVQQLQ